MNLYAENILDHSKNPRGQGRLSEVTVEHREDNPACGDELTLRLSIQEGKVAGLDWSGSGCAISQAAMSMLSEELTKKSADELLALSPKYIYDLLGVPIGPRRFKCALLCLHTLKNALRKNSGLPAQSWVETIGQE
jgi:nitrogen fixation NifU-like protein